MTDRAPSGRTFGRELILRERTDSTNSELARRLREQPLAAGTVLRALRQSHGRGTSGRVWHSDDEDGLWFSLLLREPLRVRPLSFLPAIALADLAREDLGIAASLKWPNDLLAGGRKLAGVLVESVPDPRRQTCWIVGVGLNVNQITLAAPIAELATSLRLITGRTHDPAELLRALLRRMEQLWDDAVDLVAAWPLRSEQIGAPVELRSGERTVTGTAVGLSPEGHLLVRTQAGRIERVISPTQLG
jgi:BirA family biotin operon repressor/biotin-[acetyl-CoA-carboxylase] ligase